MRLHAHLILAATVMVSALPPTDRGIRSARLTQIQSRSLVGVWKPLGIDSVGERQHAPWVTIPVVGQTGPGLLVFTARHYSLLGVATTTPRPELPDSNATVADFMATWGPFTGNAGTYEIRKDSLFTEPIVAKSPRTMRPGFRWRFVFRLSGDTLWLKLLQEANTRRYVRVE